MWKKVGSINPVSNQDNKSNRSRDQNFQDQPFSQMTKQRMSESQIFYEGNDYFFPNYLSKKKDPEIIKSSSQENIKLGKLQNVRSHKELPSQYNQFGLKKKPLNQDQIQELNTKLSSKLLEDNYERELRKHVQTPGQSYINPTHSTDLIESTTSLQSDVRRLKQCRSTPQISFAPFNSISQQIPLDKKIEAKKSILMLKKQHEEIKRILESELTDFNNEFKSMQMEMKNHISKAIQLRTKDNSTANEINTTNKLKQKSLNHEQVLPQTRKFGQKFKILNKKKTQALEKYKSLRVK